MRKQKATYLYVLIGVLVMVFGFGRGTFAQEEYRIGVDDVLSISVWETPNLSLEVVVRPDGMISFPLLDDIPAEGKTPLELKAYLTKRLSPFIKEPIVTVIVRSFNSLKVYIQGEVLKPGSYSFREKFSLAEVVAMAGGIKNESADYLKAFIMREGKKLDVDFHKLFREGDISQNIMLKPNDTIFIPDNFSSRLTVLGFVVSPGSMNYRKGMTVLDAILSAKGFSKRADLESTTVIRKVNGREERIEVNMEAVMEEGDMEKNILLLPADKIIVKEKWF
jgi:polysaccharide export outer membrane protein